MKHYNIYDLNIKSEIHFPEISESHLEESDVTISFGSVSQPDSYPNKDFVLQSSSDGGSWDKYYMKGIGGFISAKGREIKVDPEEGALERGFRFLVLGLAMGFILDQRGTVTLHASAVDLGNHSVAFAGPKGAGKSTTAAAFEAAGYPVITDDLLPIFVDEGEAYSVRGLPHLKLYPASSRFFQKKDFYEISTIDPKSAKKLYSTSRQHSGPRKPLRKIYILDTQDGLHGYNSTKIKGIDSLRHITNSLYTFQLKKDVSKEVSRKCLDISKNIELEKITRPKEYRNLEVIVDYVTKK